MFNTNNNTFKKQRTIFVTIKTFHKFYMTQESALLVETKKTTIKIKKTYEQ